MCMHFVLIYYEQFTFVLPEDISIIVYIDLF